VDGGIVVGVGTLGGLVTGTRPFGGFDAVT
jgi:hypothetical protein